MLKRTITGIGIVIVTVGFFLCKYFLDMPVFEGVFLKPVTVGDMLFDLFILIMAVVSTYEYERAFSDKLLKTEKVIIFIYPFAVYISYCFKGLGWAFGAMLFLFLLLLAQLVFEYDKISLESIGISLFTMIYPSTILVSLLVINR